jgi:hypothetical protein
MRTIDLEKWRGRRDPIPLDPTVITFRAKPAKGACKGCMFDGQWSSVCRQAAAESISRGGADCEAGFIYVATDTDPRQLKLESGLEPAATGASPTNQRPD